MTTSFEGLIFPFCELVKVPDSSAEGTGFESREGHFQNVRKGGDPGCKLDLSRGFKVRAAGLFVFVDENLFRRVFCLG